MTKKQFEILEPPVQEVENELKIIGEKDRIIVKAVRTYRVFFDMKQEAIYRKIGELAKMHPYSIQRIWLTKKGRFE